MPYVHERVQSLRQARQRVPWRSKSTICNNSSHSSGRARSQRSSPHEDNGQLKVFSETLATSPYSLFPCFALINPWSCMTDERFPSSSRPPNPPCLPCLPQRR